MDCGFLLITLRNFGSQPWSGQTNRAVCLLAVRRILGNETKTPSQGSRHHQEFIFTSGGESGLAPRFLCPSSSPESFSRLGRTSRFLHSFSALRSFRPSEGGQLGLEKAKQEAPRRGCSGCRTNQCNQEAMRSKREERSLHPSRPQASAPTLANSRGFL